ncbi:o-succinylbenzoate synthase [Thiolapillus sp.]
MNPRITLHPYNLPLKSAWPGRTQKQLRMRCGWILRLHAGGYIGTGDCAPLESAGTESFAQARQLLETWRARPPENLLEQLSRLEPLRRHRPAACHALETAILDILARQAGQPLRALLQQTTSSRFQVNHMSGDACCADIPSSTEQGYRVVKLKLGIREAQEEVHCLRMICQKLPAGVLLRLDANGAWPADSAKRVLEQLEGLAVESVEEPLANADLEALCQLQENTSVPLALDESLSRLPFDEVLDSNLPRLILKPAVQGGLSHSYHMTELAVQSGKQCVVTSVVESAVGIHAAAQLAAAVDALCPGLAHGLATSTWLQKDVASPPRIEAGCMHLSSNPGLGFNERIPLPVQDPFP